MNILPKLKSEQLGSWLVILYAFTLPISVAINNIFAAFILLFWLLKGNYKQTWQLIKDSKVLQAFLLFFLLHIVGLLWTEDFSWGLHMIKKEWMFLFAPIIMSLVKKEHIRYYVSAFLLAMTLSEIISYLIWFKVIPPIFHASVYDPTPFIHHTSYNPLLAVAIYLMGYFILFDKTLNIKEKAVLGLFIVTMSINMFITGGRAGQVGYLVAVIILFFQYFDKNFFKALLVSFLVVGGVSLTAYFGSQIFQDRIKLAVSQIENFDSDTNSSVGLRINFAINTLEMIKEDPLIGVGTGDFKKRYEEINMEKTPNIASTKQPHNMYLLEMAQFGLVGLFILLYIFYSQIRFAQREMNDLRKKIGIFLPLFFMVIMLSDSYLLGHHTTNLFVLFSAFLYRPFNEKSE
ncbi:hypothetical protein YH65_02240 [Sulfurovum lithotrophicum]|uniref:O-antigen ligase-related domain-containing protein n=1 Tax=Sulfurovum lithotrophicum TaxID=206403 RepID=A0A7U4M2Z3_9BACT|nr:O-antigen ligase family protein [Sulfurovum lithotrophicum]AKF25915.1 hypothetical protein YH65_02240 [Sulfurovum lithotrophicum]